MSSLYTLRHHTRWIQYSDPSFYALIPSVYHPVSLQRRADESVDLDAHEHRGPKVRYKAMLLLVYIDSVLCVEASIHPIPAAVAQSAQPDPKLNHHDNVYKHTQTHKHIKRCAMRAAMLLTAASSLSTPKRPPSQLATPLPTIKWKPTKLSAAPALCCPLRLQPPRLNRSCGSMR